MPLTQRSVAPVFAITSMLMAILIAIGMTVARAELIEPGLQYLCADSARLSPANQDADCTFGQGAVSSLLTSGHATALSLLVVTLPLLIGGCGSLVLPRQLGAALPWPWVQSAVALLFLAGSTLVAGSAIGGWSITVIQAGLFLATTASLVMAVVLMAAFVAGLSNAPLFSWGLVALAAFSVPTLPTLAAILITGLNDRSANTVFFDPAGERQVLYQHLLWVLGSSEIYVAALPALALITLLISGVLRHNSGQLALLVAALVMATLLGALLGLDQLFTAGLRAL